MRRRLYWLPAGALLAAHATVAVVAHTFLSWPRAWLLALGLYVITLLRFVSALRDHARPRWVTRAVDEPIFWLWGAAMTALLGLPFELLGALVLALARPRALAFGDAFQAAVVAAYAFGLLVSAWAIWVERRLVRVRRITVTIPELAAELDGYRIAQLSDLHIGSFDRLERGRAWARLTNAEQPDLCAVTGDLVTSGSDFHADVAVALAELSAPDGVFVILGNHDRSDGDGLSALLEAKGLIVLKDEHREIHRGGASLTLAGLDGRQWRSELARALAGRAPGSPTVLLAHYPNVFPAASAAGVALVLSGHTHGGQLGVPFFAQRFNLAKLSGQHSRGVFQRGPSTLYVSAGLGTTGPPMRLGVPPEIAIITLRRGDCQSW